MDESPQAATADQPPNDTSPAVLVATVNPSTTSSARTGTAPMCPSPAADPTRYIYTQADMEAFKASAAKRDLLGFATALGRSCASSRNGTSSQSYRYDPSNPLLGLSPATASLHGSLRHMAERWLAELPPDAMVRARFGNPMFREWHARLVKRSEAIIRSALDCHREYVHNVSKKKKEEEKAAAQRSIAVGTALGTSTMTQDEYSMEILQLCSEAGYSAAASDAPPSRTVTAPANEEDREAVIVQELRAYLHQAFGHPTRLDYGTGHESSFLILIFCLCKLRCIGNGTSPPDAVHLAPVALAIFSQYLQVTRGLQRDYMLEPAGSHGVWGLDDYHCLPFYFGACQLQAVEEEDRASVGGGGSEDITPRSIHDDSLLKRLGDTYMYLGCIRYIKELKSSVPFFESSPMLDDISNLPSWGRVSRGLLRLYDGEVLVKLPVVQHFLFGTLFQGKGTALVVKFRAISSVCCIMLYSQLSFYKSSLIIILATWTPSALPREAPERTFINGPGGEECIAPWAQADLSSSIGPASEVEGTTRTGLPPTRAPWAK